MDLGRFVVVIGTVAILGCDSPARAPEIASTGPSCIMIGMTVSPASLTLSVGDTAHVTAKLPACETVTPLTFAWRSSNRAVVLVDSASGSVQALAIGQASIVAKLTSDTTVSGAAIVLVNPR